MLSQRYHPAELVSHCLRASPRVVAWPLRHCGRVRRLGVSYPCEIEPTLLRPATRNSMCMRSHSGWDESVPVEPVRFVEVVFTGIIDAWAMSRFPLRWDAPQSALNEYRAEEHISPLGISALDCRQALAKRRRLACGALCVSFVLFVTGFATNPSVSVFPVR